MDKLFYLLAFAVLVGCANDDLMVGEEPVMEVDMEATGIFKCFNIDLTNWSLPCNENATCMDVFDEQINLSDSAKVLFPQFCLEKDENISFVDHDGIKVNFRVEEKRRSINGIGNPLYSHYCPNTTNVLMNYCANMEVATLKLYSNVLDYRFEIRMTSTMDNHADEGNLYGTALRILRYYDPAVNPGALGRFEFEKIVEQVNLTYSEVEGEQHFLSIVVNGKTYNDVYSYTIEDTTDPQFKFYYNKEFGLFGFEDIDGKVWTLE